MSIAKAREVIGTSKQIGYEKNSQISWLGDQSESAEDLQKLHYRKGGTEKRAKRKQWQEGKVASQALVP